MSLPRSIRIGYANFVDHVYTPTLLRTHSAQLFDWIARGVLKVRIGATYPLAEASRAHADIEGRTTVGKHRTRCGAFRTPHLAAQGSAYSLIRAFPECDTER